MVTAQGNGKSGTTSIQVDAKLKKQKRSFTQPEP
jgi:hypothetical protein